MSMPTKVRKYVVSWTSDASGDATATLPLDGAIMRVVTNPDDTAAPTDNYDVTIVDGDGLDLLNSEGLDRDTLNSEQIFPTNPPFHNGDVTVTIANAGNTKAGTVTLYVAWG